MNYCILSSIKNAELANQIVEELEKISDDRCYFNLRDASNYEKPSYWKCWTKHSLIFILDDESVSKKKFWGISDGYLGDNKEIRNFFVKIDPVNIPTSYIDRINIIEGSQNIDAILYEITHPGQPFQPNETQIKNISNENQNISETLGQNNNSLDAFSTSSSLEEKNIIEGENFNHSSPDIQTSFNNNNIEEAECDCQNNDIHSYGNEELIDNETFMPIYRSVSNCKSDGCKEGYGLPLFILPFEYGEKRSSPIDKICNNIQSPSIPLQRALRYLIGNGVPQNIERAFELFNKAANDNPSDNFALFALGMHYNYGIGTKIDKDQATFFFERAYENGNIQSLLELGRISLWDLNNLDRAKTYFQEARNKGNVEASYHLGLLCLNENQFDDAFEYFSEAAELGFANAQNALAVMYYNGRGVEENKSLALEWLKLAIDQNLDTASHNAAIHALNDSVLAGREDSISNDDLQMIQDSLIYELGNAHLFYNLGIIESRRAIKTSTNYNKVQNNFNIASNFNDYSLIEPHIFSYQSNYEREQKKRDREARMEQVAKTTSNILDFFNKL